MATTNSYWNIIAFLLTTIFYYLAMKPQLSYDIKIVPDAYENYTRNNYMFLGVYFLLVMFVQFMVNASVMSSKCGGNLTDNIGAAGLLTFVPWVLIFGVVMVMLIVFPGFKSAFSDVIGYFYVSGQANNVLTELLLNKDVDISSLPSEQERKKLSDATDLVVKICGNTSILINQMVPENFDSYWNILKPLMKPAYQVESPQTKVLRDQLFDLVVTRDNVGEIMWYIYTGILLISIVQLKISTRACNTNPKTMEKQYNAYLKEQKKDEKREKQATQTVYRITN